MPYTKSNAPKQIQGLPEHAQEIWIAAYNSSSEKLDEASASKIAWSAVASKYEKKGEQWVAKESVDRAIESLLSGAPVAEALNEGPPYGMNQDELYGYYQTRALRVGGQKYADTLGRAMSEMLGMGVTPSVVWAYAEKDLTAAREKHASYFMKSEASGKPVLQEVSAMSPGSITGQFSNTRDFYARVNSKLQSSGLDGNGRFNKPGEALNRAASILADFGLMTDTATGGFQEYDVFSGRIGFGIYKPEPGAPSGAYLKDPNRLFIMQWTKMKPYPGPGTFEVIAYIS